MKELVDTSIESRIIKLLQKSPRSTLEIVAYIQKSRSHTPKQSVYLALRKLKAKEVVTIHKKIVSLHKVWVANMKEFFKNAYEQSEGVRQATLLELQEKESVTYKFNSLLALDMYWSHAFMSFMSEMSHGEMVCLYNPHQWFLIARQQSELSVIKEACRRKVSWIQLIAGKKKLDIEVKKYFDGISARCHFLGKNIFGRNYYANCFKDYVIEVWLDERAVMEIENIYDECGALNQEVVQRFQKVIENKKYSHKMKISKNGKLAARLMKIFKTYFLI